MRHPLVMGNWKLNGSRHMVHELVSNLRKELAGVAGCAVAIAPPEMYIDMAKREAEGSHIMLGAQNVDLGAEYLDSTLFLGDSNTVRLYNNGLISLQQFCAKEGIGTQVALNEGIVTFKNDTTHYTIAQAVAKMKPRRVVMTFGTNDTGMEVADFISNYTALVQAIQEAYPYTDIIVNTVPPIGCLH